jgi:hypothetical protein
MEFTINGRKRRVNAPADMPVLWVLPPPIAAGTSGPSRRHLPVRPSQGSDHESGAERWQSAVHVESMIRQQVV